MDEFIFIPVQTLQKKVMGIDHVLYIFNQVDPAMPMDRIADDITMVLRERHGTSDPDSDDFSVTTMTEALETLDTVLVPLRYY